MISMRIKILALNSMEKKCPKGHFSIMIAYGELPAEPTANRSGAMQGLTLPYHIFVHFGIQFLLDPSCNRLPFVVQSSHRVPVSRGLHLYIGVGAPENGEIFSLRGLGMQKKDINMLSGSITKGLLLICVPVMIMNVITSLFNIVDMTILKNFDTDGLAVGAVGVCSAPIGLISNLVIGIATGANVIVANYIGQRDQRRINRATGTAVALSAAAGLLLAAAGVLFAEVFLEWVNCPPELLARATPYFRMYFAGIPLLMVYNFCGSLLRASGDSQTVMKISIIGGAAKICATYLFVAIFRMGIIGVAVSTIVSWLVFSSLSLASLCLNRGSVKLSLKSIRFYRPELRQILRIGIPAGIQMGLYSFANVLISSAVNSFGAQATTGISIANTFDVILYYICQATSLAIMPYVSQNLGAGKARRAWQSVMRGILLTVGIGAFFGSLSAIFSTQLSSLMSSDPVVLDYSRQKMIIISSTYFICGINEIFSAALRGMGRSLFPTVTTFVFMCGLRVVWVYLIFPLVPNLTFLYLVWPIGWISCIICALFVYIPTRRRIDRQLSGKGMI